MFIKLLFRPELYICMGTKGDWDFRSGKKKPLMELILTPVVNFGEVQRAQLANFTLLTSTLMPLGYFQIF